VPKLTYKVVLDPSDSTAVSVRLFVSAVPRDSLVLDAYAPQEILRLDRLKASGPDGRWFGIRVRGESVLVHNNLTVLPHYIVRGPLPNRLSISYRVRPGARQGNAHLGFTGRRFGYVSREFCFATGRQLFLIPQQKATARDIRVGFVLPAGWQAATPWQRRAGGWFPGVRGRYAAEDLISASVGLGKFANQSFRVGRTAFQVSFPLTISGTKADEIRRHLETAALHVHALFGRDLGQTYFTIALPESPDEDEIIGEAWATGQGRTLAPLTAERMYGFAEGLMNAYLRYAPYRSEIRRPEEYWLVDAVSTIHAWRAVARTGLLSEEELRRNFTLRYAETLPLRGVERDLEHLYPATRSYRMAAKAIAPFTLLLLERELRNSTRGTVKLDAVLREIFSRSQAGSIWLALERDTRADWDGFRERYVRGTSVAPLASLDSLAPTHPDPSPPQGRAVRNLTIVLTGNTHGYLENCGCKVNQSGGVARRSHQIRKVRAHDPDMILLDAGSAFPNSEKEINLDFLARQEERLYFRLMDRMDYDAAAVGSTELGRGLRHFKEIVAGSSMPYLSSNITGNGQPIADQIVYVKRGDVRIAVLGLFEQPRLGEIGPALQERTGSLTIEDPKVTLQRLLPAVRKSADLVIAMGRLTPATIREVADSFPELDAIISTEFEVPSLAGGAGRQKLIREDAAGFLGRTLVLYAAQQSYGLGVAQLGLDREGRIASADIKPVWLRSDVPDDPEVRDLLNQFYDRVGRMEAAQSSVRPLFKEDHARMNERYAGAGACKACHEAEYAQWATTKHAFAYKTLLDAHRHYQPKCVVCHVVGLGTRHGYRLGQPEELLGNVQCEVCHGPGAKHLEGPSPDNITRSVPAAVCLECHNPDHSDNFVYAERLPSVKHDFERIPVTK
jgi:2',3'-cyclic-nucleotide 2'-phosphodiesterase (5'-nucleotidase family)